MNTKNEIKVSISTISYNHVNYIEQCLDGFLMQKTDFNFEVLIHDDASTDGTDDIIKEYTKKYSKLIFPLYETENQWSKGRRGSIVFNFPRAKGKYIALCEGDDYWTDPFKLQKQVDFLEKHKDYSLCCGGYDSYNEETKELKNNILSKISLNEDDLGFSFGLNEMKDNWITKSLNLVFRKDLLVSINISKYNYFRDIHLNYHLLKTGRGYYFKEFFGVYRIHEGGIHSMKSRLNYLNISYLIYKELYEKNIDEFTRYKYLKHQMMLFHYILYRRKTEELNIDRYILFKEISELIKSKEEYVRLIKSFSPRAVISENIRKKL